MPPDVRVGPAGHDIAGAGATRGRACKPGEQGGVGWLPKATLSKLGLQCSISIDGEMRACGRGVAGGDGREGGGEEEEGATTSISSSKPSTSSSSAKLSRASTSASVSLSSSSWGSVLSCLACVGGAGRAHAGRVREILGRSEFKARSTAPAAKAGSGRR